MDVSGQGGCYVAKNGSPADDNYMSHHNNDLRSRSFYRRQSQRSSYDGLYLPVGAVRTPQPIVTFVPNRDAPIFTHVQNNGSLVTSSDSLSIQPVEKRRPVNQPRAKREPDTPLAQTLVRYRPYSSELTRRVEAKRGARPSEEEVLLRRLQEGLRRDSAQGSRPVQGPRPGSVQGACLAGDSNGESSKASGSKASGSKASDSNIQRGG
ncbi:hypothetical protein B0H16DRAFT_1474369 [Mycena metata]|uniref:Uncharacterized protein n=1 Tax=Mycena metata TaxID=1033252 RepID=A0AAD7HID5_9AGAR|nr:hypothetical protein B0H16DRAFT_1474369 [Mycena metata]